MKLCPYCSSKIENSAVKCDYCQRWLDPQLDATLNADSPPIVLPPRVMSGLAIASLVCGLFWVAGIGSVAAVILGYLALRQIRRDPLRVRGRGMAIAGITLGWLGVAGLLIMILLGFYFWRNHAERSDLRTAPLSGQSAALASVLMVRKAESGISCSWMVISQAEGSARSRLTSCVCSEWPALRASTLPSKGNPTKARSPIKSRALCLPNSSG